MSKFKVGDKVVRNTGYLPSSEFNKKMGNELYYTVTDVSPCGYWLQVDGYKHYGERCPWYALNFELYQEPEDELPPAPTSVSYLKDDGRRKLVAKITGGSVTLLLNLHKVSTLAYSLDPDAALQLAHDLRRMAMAVKRKEKAQ